LAERGSEVLFDGEESVGADSVSPVEAEGVEDSASGIDRRLVSDTRQLLLAGRDNYFFQPPPY
jgi:hypothetical protein